MTKQEAVEIAIAHVAGKLRAALERELRVGRSWVFEGWPENSYVVRRDLVWSVTLPEGECHVGSSRVIVISQTTAEILFDGRCGE